jgi:hypothetical protein
MGRDSCLLHAGARQEEKKRRAITKKEGTKIVIDPSLPQLLEIVKIV